jgi:hypothetical protein
MPHHRKAPKRYLQGYDVQTIDIRADNRQNANASQN